MQLLSSVRRLVVLVVLATATTALPIAEVSTGDDTLLKPVGVDAFQRVLGVPQPSSTDLSRLGLTDNAHLVYGGQKEDGQFIMVNMTLYAPDGMQIINMELFDDLTSEVDCLGDDGEISLTFKSQAAFDYALNEWTWVNENREDKFYLVANHAGCGPDEERQVYTITYVANAAGSLKTVLTAKPAKWEDVAGTYDLNFGSFDHPNARTLLETRGNVGDVSAVETRGLGDWNPSASIRIPVNAGQPGKRTPLFQGQVIDLDCINCYVGGAFRITGRVSVHWFRLKALTVSAAPQDVSASLEMQASLTAAASGPRTVFNQTTEIFSAPIPGAGFRIPKIFKIGAMIELDVGASVSLAGHGTFTAGMTASLPNNALMVADIMHPSLSTATGWDLTFNPIFNIDEVSGSIDVAASAQPKLTLGMELVSVGKLDAFLGMRLPEVVASLTAIADSRGACHPGVAGASPLGVKLSSSISVDLFTGVDASLGKGDPEPVISKDLWTYERSLPETCFEIELPGSGAAVKDRSPPGRMLGRI